MKLKFIVIITLILFPFIAIGCSGGGGGSSPSEKALTSIYLSRYCDTLEIGTLYDFSRIKSYARYSSEEIAEISPRWFNGSVEIETSCFFVPQFETAVKLIASYSENSITKTTEVTLNSVRAETAAYFSLTSDTPAASDEITINRLSPALKILIGSSSAESVIIKRLVFSISGLDEISQLNSAFLCFDNIRYRASLNSPALASFNFTSPLIINVNSVKNISISINLNESAGAAAQAGRKIKVSLSSSPSDIDISGEFFGKKIAQNITGLPISSNELAVAQPESAEVTIAAINENQKYRREIIKSGELLKPGVMIKSFDPKNEKLAMIVYNPSTVPAGCNLSVSEEQILKSYAGQASKNYSGVSAISPKDAGSYEYGQRNADRIMRELEKTLSRTETGYNAPSKAPAQISNGDLMRFNVINVKSYAYIDITAEVRAIGGKCYVFEEIDMPERYEKMSTSEAESVAAAFDNDIYPKVRANFGEEPNPGIDGDPKVYLLFTRIVNEGTALGYFSALNEMKRYSETGVEQYRYSNEKEIVFAAAYDNQSEFKKNGQYSKLILNIFSHEFQHLINWNYRSKNNSYEETWVNEGLSLLAEDIAGYGYQNDFSTRRIKEFFTAPYSFSLTNFKYLNRGSYGFSYLFFRYLHERGAIALNMVNSQSSGVQNVETEIKRASIAPDFNTAFENFLTALYFESEGYKIDPAYQYQAITLRGSYNFVGAIPIELNGMAESASIFTPENFSSPVVEPYGFNIIKLDSAQAAIDLFLSFNSSGYGLKAQIIRTK